MDRRQVLLGGLVVGALVTGDVSLTPEPSASRSPKGSPDRAADDRRRRRFANVTLTTHEGKKVRFYDDLIKDRTVLINFMYTNCVAEVLCPLMTSNLVRVQQELGARVGRDVFMYSITLDPEHDTPRVLASYAQAFSVKPGWSFLTGSKDDVEILRRNLGFSTADPILDKDRTQHVGMVKYGIERLERWAGCPALSTPTTIVRNVYSLERQLDWGKPTARS